jgi:hypothetical protein
MNIRDMEFKEREIGEIMVGAVIFFVGVVVGIAIMAVFS